MSLGVLYPNGQVLAVTPYTGLQLLPWDHAELAQPNATTDIWTFKFNGTTTDIVTLVFTDSTHNTISTIDKT